MVRLNTRTTNPAGASRSPLRTTNTAATTHEGGSAVTLADKTALFLMATATFFGEDSFYEKGGDRAARFGSLCRTVAVADPKWYAQFVAWLRSDANIRTGSVVAAAEGAAAWQQAKITGTRSLVRSVLLRADEVGEFLAYWRHNMRRAIPGGVQRALQDRISGVSEKDVVALYNEFNVIKWDKDSAAYRFADAVELTHPKPRDAAQADLFRYLLDERHHKDGKLTERLTMLRRHVELRSNLLNDRPNTLRAILADPDLLKGAGMTWENLSSSGPMDKRAWTAIIPQMGYMALLRNLRNFEQAGVDQAILEKVAAKLSNPDQVAKSRQMPYRFLSAYLEIQHGLWLPALEEALTHSCRNIPALGGETVVLVDTSSSMRAAMSDKSKISCVSAGALFGVALASAQRNAALYGFADGPADSVSRGSWYRATASNPFRHDVAAGAAVLRTTEAFVRRIGENGHGTNIADTLQWAARLHPKAARFVIVTDGQCSTGDVGAGSTPNVPVYAFSLGGYGVQGMPSSHNRHFLGGLTDHTFALIRNIEAAQTGKWPWEVAA